MWSLTLRIQLFEVGQSPKAARFSPVLYTELCSMELGEPVGWDLHGRFNGLLARPQTCIFTLDSFVLRLQYVRSNYNLFHLSWYCYCKYMNLIKRAKFTVDVTNLCAISHKYHYPRRKIFIKSKTGVAFVAFTVYRIRTNYVFVIIWFWNTFVCSENSKIVNTDNTAGVRRITNSCRPNFEEIKLRWPCTNKIYLYSFVYLGVPSLKYSLRPALKLSRLPL